MTTSRTIEITAADDEGTPLAAACPCGAVWRRPMGDAHASTLSRWAGAHVCDPQLELFHR